MVTLYEVLFGLENTAYETRTKLFFPTINLTAEHNLFIEYICLIGTVRSKNLGFSRQAEIYDKRDGMLAK